MLRRELFDNAEVEVWFVQAGAALKPGYGA